MSTGIGCLGEVVFVVSADVVRTFDQFSRVSRAVYAHHETVGKKPTSEFTGMELQTAQFTIHLNATLGISPQEEMKTLIAMQQSGDAFVLMLGNTVYGFWTIGEVSEEVVHTFRGTPMVSDVQLSITEFDDTLTGPGLEAYRRDRARTGTAGGQGPRKVAEAKHPLRPVSLSGAQ